MDNFFSILDLIVGMAIAKNAINPVTMHPIMNVVMV